MAQYRKRPEIVDAYKYQAELGNNRLMNWLALHKVPIDGWIFHDGDITIKTPEGGFNVVDGDFIIRDENGKISAMDPASFEATYEVPTTTTEGPAPSTL